MSQTSLFILNKAGNVELQEEPDSARAHYTYDLLGHVVSAKMPGSKETTSTYNELGWPLRIEEHYLAADKPGTPEEDLMLITTFTYDKAGRVLSKTVSGDETTYIYNAAGDLLVQINPDGSSLGNTYNSFGDVMRHVEHATDKNLAHDIAYSFDALGKEIAAKERASFGVSKESTHTTAASQEDTSTTGEISSVTFLTPHFTTRMTTNTSQQFDDASLSNETSEVARIKVGKRDGAGRILALNSSLLPQLLTRSFDEAGRLKTMSFEASRTQSYSYVDKSNKLSSWDTLGHLESFGYDKDTGRLNESNEATYTFGANSALPLRSPLAPSASQYAPSGLDATQTLNAPTAQASEPHALDYTFNAKGQRTGTKNAALSWQGERLISLETSDTYASYTYDASGMRLKANITASDGANQTLRYVYDGLRLLELNSAGTTETSNFSIGYLYEADNQTPTSASYETTDTTTPFTLESNVRGDVIALRDKSGVIFARYIYSEYGVCKAIEINATENIDETLAQAIAHNQPLRYAGYVYDEYSKMYYCAARYYDPATQVFISLDPVRADGERSGYLYCNGDPVNSVDPSGLFTKPLTSYFLGLSVHVIRCYTRIKWISSAFWTGYSFYAAGPAPGMTGSPVINMVHVSMKCAISASYNLKRIGSKHVYAKRHLTKIRSLTRDVQVFGKTGQAAKNEAKRIVKK